MNRSIRSIVIILTAGLLLASGCGLIVGRNSAGDVAESFYKFQQNPDTAFPGEIFIDDEVAMQSRSMLNRREMAYGPYVSHKRIATNRRMSMEGKGRKEMVTYVFEVTGENGRTRETLMLTRESAAEPFIITAYVIEDIPRLGDPAPAGTSST